MIDPQDRRRMAKVDGKTIVWVKNVFLGSSICHGEMSGLRLFSVCSCFSAATLNDQLRPINLRVSFRNSLCKDRGRMGKHTRSLSIIDFQCMPTAAVKYACDTSTCGYALTSLLKHDRD